MLGVGGTFVKTVEILFFKQQSSYVHACQSRQHNKELPPKDQEEFMLFITPVFEYKHVWSQININVKLLRLTHLDFDHQGIDSGLQTLDLLTHLLFALLQPGHHLGEAVHPSLQATHLH